MNSQQEKELVQQAILAKEKSYSPYSKFRVGAALLGKSGKIYTGCNVENASYGGAICAERTCFVKAVSEGEKEFLAIAVNTDSDKRTYPCGFCRQFMIEFGKELWVLTSDKTGKNLGKDVLQDLLPFAFGPWDLLHEQFSL